MKKSVLTLIGGFLVASLQADTASENFQITGDALIPTFVSESDNLTIESTLTPVGMITSSSNLTLLGGITTFTDPFSAEPLVIETAPEAVTVFVGQPISLSVVATGSDTLTYQWSVDGAAIEGAVAATLEIPVAADTDAGAYTVAVTSGSETIESEAADVVVLALPVITGPAEVTEGDAFDLTVDPLAEGATVAWSLDDVAIDGVDGATYSVASAALTNAGSYVVTITVGELTATSEAFVLTVQEALEDGTFPLPEAIAAISGATFIEDRGEGDALASVYSTLLGDVFVDSRFAAEGAVYSSLLGWIYPAAAVGEGAWFYSIILDAYVFVSSDLAIDGGFYAYVLGDINDFVLVPSFNDASDGQIWVYQFASAEWVLIP